MGQRTGQPPVRSIALALTSAAIKGALVVFDIINAVPRSLRSIQRPKRNASMDLLMSAQQGKARWCMDKHSAYFSVSPGIQGYNPVTIFCKRSRCASGVAALPTLLSSTVLAYSYQNHSIA